VCDALVINSLHDQLFHGWWKFSVLLHLPRAHIYFMGYTCEDLLTRPSKRRGTSFIRVGTRTHLLPAFQNVLDSRRQQACHENVDMVHFIARYVTWQHSQVYYPLAGQTVFGRMP
jgi:hypothetical protein